MTQRNVIQTVNPSLLTTPITFNLPLAGASSSGASISGTSGTPRMFSGTGTGTSGGNAMSHGSGAKPKAKVKVEEPGKNFLLISWICTKGVEMQNYKFIFILDSTDSDAPVMDNDSQAGMDMEEEVPPAKEIDKQIIIGKKCPFLFPLQGLKCRTTHLYFYF